ncbi:type I glyceraldehyde-3-phosphate dehydrogenase [Nanoarchaeota archaeon]
MVRIGINGMGRIGKLFMRNLVERDEETQNSIRVCAVNDFSDEYEMTHNLKYDTTHGICDKVGNVMNSGNCKSVNIGKKSFTVYNEKDPERIPWFQHDIDLVLEATGKFTDYDKAKLHKADNVIISAPGKGDYIQTMVYGINHHSLDILKYKVISNASCTTNCLAPILKVLDQEFTIRRGFMVTVHSYTNDQNLIDSYHKDQRRSRSAANNIIPTSTGADDMIKIVMPKLAGKIDGYAIRVPTPNVSLVDMVVQVGTKHLDPDKVNVMLNKASREEMKGIMGFSYEPLVSSDFNGRKESCIIDKNFTMVKDNMVRVVAWYDNETGYVNRLIDLISYIDRRKKK